MNIALNIVGAISVPNPPKINKLDCQGQPGKESLLRQTIYLENAVKLAVNKHADQVDKNGMPYIFHLLRVMNKMADDDLKTVAVLHDLLEDTDTSEEELVNIGIPGHLIEVLKILDKRQYKVYEDYIDHVEKNPLAVKVKLADLEDNMDLTRLEVVTDREMDRLIKYHKAWKRLKMKIDI